VDISHSGGFASGHTTTSLDTGQEGAVASARRRVVGPPVDEDDDPMADRTRPGPPRRQTIESYLAAHPGDTVDTLDLWQNDLPEINGPALEAAYAAKRGQPHSPEQLHVWQAIVRIADRFKSADKYLVSLPMWNFSVPYKLKHYIDLLVHRGLRF
jgi:FMN-dependent NADH-azoreductase